MSFRMPKNETGLDANQALQTRALRFAGVRLGAEADAAPQRPELVIPAPQDGRFEQRLARFVHRSGKTA